MKINRQILFLCTGNYYRSRFAEHFFNALAKQQSIDWQADSRGLAIESGTGNVGAISPYAVQYLSEQDIVIPKNERRPRSVTVDDFVMANKVIALDVDEHRPLMLKRFPQWAEQVEYWSVPDLHITPPELALPQIKQQIFQLINSLSSVTSHCSNLHQTTNSAASSLKELT